VLRLVCSIQQKGSSTISVLNEIFFFYGKRELLPNIIRVMKSRRLRWAGHVARMGERRGAYRALVGQPEGRKPLGRPRRRWEDNIKMDLREVGWRGMD
jgi:hypothetical protein